MFKITLLMVIFSLCSSQTVDASYKWTRDKRETQECAAKFQTVSGHSACQKRSPEVESAGVGETDIQTILLEHNTYRSSVTPPATNMLKLTWDSEIAMVAQAWAETCSFLHDESLKRGIPGRLSAGQNIGQGYQTWQACIKAWYDEVRDFTYNGTNVFKSVGHYTQLVWADTTKIGCGYARCTRGTFHVCNYSPAGNMGDIKMPYKTGTKCKDCKICDSALNGLCDCGEKVCENGGTLHTNNCTCSCRQPFHVGDECTLNCRNLTEPWMCGSSGYDAAGCIKYSATVPFDCPNTCGVCSGYLGGHSGGWNIHSFSLMPITFLIVQLYLLTRSGFILDS